MSQLPNPGDLAYIVREYAGCEENIGAVVLVLRDQSTPKGFWPASPGEVWMTSSARPLACINDEDGGKYYALPGEPSRIERAFLRKIAGPSVSAEVLRDEGVPA